MQTMTALSEKPNILLRDAGQSPWLDFISRDLLRSGKLAHLIREGVLGVTSNPSIFEKAINQPKGGYEKQIRELIRKNVSTFDIYDALTIDDIQTACDLFEPVFRKSGDEHGFVSLEVMPGLAYYEDDTVEEAIRLFKKVARPNVMIKIPATPQGIPAIRRLIGQGININVTLMFSVTHYQDVALAYIEGLEDFARAGGNLSKVHSVASVFVSRVDAVVDKQLTLMSQDQENLERKAEFESLKGKAAVANSKLIYTEFKNLFLSERFEKLKKRGAWVQKVLWGSTSTKNPAYSDLMYVEPLIGKETVNTMPQNTLEAFMDHGQVRQGSIEEGIEEAKQVVRKLNDLGLDLNGIGEKLQEDGARLFCDAFDVLMASIERIMRDSQKPAATKQKFSFKVDRKTAQSEAVLEAISEMEHAKAHDRFLQKNPGLWKEDGAHQKVILNRLGWLQVADWMLGKLYELDLLQSNIRKEGIKDVVLLGMGGSSLAPEVMNLICGKGVKKNARLHVLDTTDPAAILSVEKSIKLNKTLFIIASKSGSTIETVSQFQYFYEQIKNLYKKLKGNQLKKRVGNHFIAITDDGSWLQTKAAELAFRRTFVNPTDIGGRYSALSYFGMVPAALIGLPVRAILQSAHSLWNHVQIETSLEKNSAFYLGVLLGELAEEGKNKLVFFISSSLAPFGSWLEQLIAESTGKEGKGIIPVVGEIPQEPSAYSGDHVFVVIRRRGEKEKSTVAKVQKLTKAGFPVLELEWPDTPAIGGEFLSWEIATSIAACRMGINPFDEPNVKESKEMTGALLEKLRTSKRLEAPKQSYVYQSGKLVLGRDKLKAREVLKTFLGGLKQQSYISILCYTKRDADFEKQLGLLQRSLRKQYKVPVLTGFGPRYLHSIGQLYKGGPKMGLFIELVQEDAKDKKVPQTHFTFGQLIKAQAYGDYQALTSKGLPVLLVQLGKTPLKALSILVQNWVAS